MEAVLDQILVMSGEITSNEGSDRNLCFPQMETSNGCRMAVLWLPACEFLYPSLRATSLPSKIPPDLP